MIFRSALTLLLLALPGAQAVPGASKNRKLKKGATPEPTPEPTVEPTPQPTLSIVTQTFSVYPDFMNARYTVGSKFHRLRDRIESPCASVLDSGEECGDIVSGNTCQNYPSDVPDCQLTCSVGSDCFQESGYCDDENEEETDCLFVDTQFAVEGYESYTPVTNEYGGDSNGHVLITVRQGEAHLEDTYYFYILADLVDLKLVYCPESTEQGCFTAENTVPFNDVPLQTTNGDARRHLFESRGLQGMCPPDLLDIELGITSGTGEFAGAQGVIFVDLCNFVGEAHYIPNPVLQSVEPSLGPGSDFDI